MTKILSPELRIMDLNALSIPSRIWIQQQVDISIYTSAHAVLLFRFCFHSIKQTAFSCCAHPPDTLYSVLFRELHLLHTFSNTRHVVVTEQTAHCPASDPLDTLPSLSCAHFQDICKAHNATSLQNYRLRRSSPAAQRHSSPLLTFTTLLFSLVLSIKCHTT